MELELIHLVLKLINLMWNWNWQNGIDPMSARVIQPDGIAGTDVRAGVSWRLCVQEEVAGGCWKWIQDNNNKKTADITPKPYIGHKYLNFSGSFEKDVLYVNVKFSK